MLKWIILILVLSVVTIFVIALIKFMLKAEKDSKKADISTAEQVKEEYKQEEAPINIHSASGAIPVTDMSSKAQEDNFINDIIDDVPDLPMPMGNNGFFDDADDEFNDYSKFAHNSKGRRRQPDFDLEGDMADEYIPDSPDFNYLPRRRQTKKQPIEQSLNELPTELKVLMLSDIFDRKF